MTSAFTPSPADDRSGMNTDDRSKMNTDDRSKMNTEAPRLPTVPQADDAAAPGEVALPGQYIRVYFDDDPAGFVVRTQNRDRVGWEKTTARHKWGSAQDNPNTFIAYVTWSAAKRDGQTELTHAQWEAQLVDYDIVDEAPARPTR